MPRLSAACASFSLLFQLIDVRHRSPPLKVFILKRQQQLILYTMSLALILIKRYCIVLQNITKRDGRFIKCLILSHHDADRPVVPYARQIKAAGRNRRAGKPPVLYRQQPRDIIRRYFSFRDINKRPGHRARHVVQEPSAHTRSSATGPFLPTSYQ